MIVGTNDPSPGGLVSAIGDRFWEQVVPTAVQVLPDDHFGGIDGRVLVTAFGQGRILQFTVDRTTGIATGLGTWVKDLPHLMDLQFAADGNLYALITDHLHRIKPPANRQVHYAGADRL